MSAEWITWGQAAELVGCSESVIDYRVRTGQIKSRPLRHGRGYQPTLNRASVEEFGARWRPLNAEWEQRKAERAQRVPEPIGPSDDGQVWLDLPTAALVIGCSAQWVGRLASQERIPAVR